MEKIVLENKINNNLKNKFKIRNKIKKQNIIALQRKG